MASNKLNRKWLKGIWLGKLERDDSNVIGTEAGAIAVRSVRRLTQANQIDAEIMSKIRGLPWRPKDGHQVTREKSEVVIMPAPVIGADPRVEDKEGEGDLPQLALDQDNPDQDELLVEGHDQLEELFGSGDEYSPSRDPV